MRLQLDTIKKTIRLEEPVKLSELMITLESLLPNELWKEFTLESSIINNFTNPLVTSVIINPIAAPIIIRDHPTYPHYPWITYQDDQFTLLPGVYSCYTERL